MIHARLPVLVLAFAAACSPPATAEFGPPKTYSKDQRPLEWDAPRNVRLGVRDMGPASGGQAQGQGGAERVWVGDVPAGFETAPANPSRFRDAVWRITGDTTCEIYLTASVGGGVAGNLSRWYRDQFGMPEVPTLESLPVVELAGKPGRLAELRGTFAGKPGWAALIAFVPQGDQMMTFKFTGPESVVTGNKEKFIALAKSLRTATKSPDPKAGPIEPGAKVPDGHPPIDGGKAPNQQGTPTPAPTPAAPFTATAPAGWTPKAGSSKPLHHGFGKDGDVYVSQLGGALNASLDIWRGEMGLKQPLTPAELAALPKIAFLGEDAVLLDLSGDLQGMTRQLPGARMLVAARLDGQSITFAKLTGSAAEVAAQLDAFRAFCGSVRRAP